MSAVMVADPELKAKREADEAKNAAWHAKHQVERAQQQAELRARLSAKKHATARRLGEAHLIELRRQILELEPVLAEFERRMRAVCRYEADAYAEFQTRYGNDVGEQLFTDHVGHRVVGEVRARVEKASG